MTTPSAPETISPETIAGVQAAAATLLGTAALTLRSDGQLRLPITAVGPFYAALAADPAGMQFLITAALRPARAAMKRGLPSTAHQHGMSVAAFPLPTANGDHPAPGANGIAGAGTALVLFTSPGVRPEMRATVAADLGLPNGAVPLTAEPFDQARAAVTLRFIEQSLAMAAGPRPVKSGSDAEARRDRILYTATKAISKALDESDVLRTTAETLAGLLHMDVATVYTLGNEGWEARESTSYWGEPATDYPPLSLTSESAAALQRGEIIATVGDRPNSRRVLVPILTVTRESRELDAVVAMQAVHAAGPVSAAEQDLAILISRQSSLALRNARSATLERTLARKLQETLQSHFDAVAIPNLTVEEFYRPAAQDARVGGDFYDVFPLPEGRVAVLVGDVAGKGLDAAIHTTLARYTLRAYALMTPDPTEVLRRTNEALARFREFKDFLTVALVILDPAAGQLCYASAGHCPIFLYRRGADAIGTLESTGTLLGMMPGITWDSEIHKWSSGDVLLLYTDGISEAHAPGSVELFETTRIRDLFAAHRQAPPRTVVDAIYQAAENFSEGMMHDDCAMLVVTQHE